MQQLQQLIKTFTSPNSKFFMPMNEFISELASLAPYFMGKTMQTPEPGHKICEDLLHAQPQVEGVDLTVEYDSMDVADQSVAYHPVTGTIVAQSFWRTSTKQLQKNLISADQNSRISAHFIHITSAGGEAWYLDRLAQTIRNLRKPAHAFIERIAGSAAYYIASQTDHISASTPFDIVGSIGTMVSFMDVQPMLEKWGIAFIEQYATQSDLKNKKYKDLMAGKPRQFINEELDPLAAKFIADVRQARQKLDKLDDDHPLFRGETFYADKALAVGLVDAVEDYSQSLLRLKENADARHLAVRNRSKALQFLN